MFFIILVGPASQVVTINQDLPTLCSRHPTDSPQEKTLTAALHPGQTDHFPAMHFKIDIANLEPVIFHRGMLQTKDNLIRPQGFRSPTDMVLPNIISTSL